LKISYGITVHNEAEELQKLLEVLNKNIDKEDEIIVCVDGDDEKVEAVLGESLDSWQHYIVYKRKLDGNFADHKNSVIEKSSGDYIFHIDADEFPNEILLQQLKQILEMNDVDLVWIPRVNTVDGFTQEDVQKWGWRVDEKGWVNYPDYQARVFRNREDIRWTRPLHEYITGCKTYAHLPPHEELSLYHPKTKEKQEQQNKFYMDNFKRELLVRS
jgi:glycosyltransferase involved in cell wall biosynthesis|tara:strand:+ start:141 stop:785 length:645 start_codon:yes stop_codon:yes gene_type:complete